MNPHAAQPSSLQAMVLTIWHHRRLIWQMTVREVVGRYKGSVMGLFWSFLTPVFMLAVYTYFFAVVFKSKWGGGGVGGDDSKTQFAIILFVGIIVHGLLAEVFNRAPTLILANANFVKKVVFPLEILSVISLAAALFHAAISILVLLTAFFVFNGYLHWTVLYLPFVLAPFIILILGFSWIIASLGVYVRDLGQTMGLVVMVLMFVSPVFYSLASVPPDIQFWAHLNPLTFIIEQARDVVIWGKLPHRKGLLLYTLIAALVAWFGFFWFQRTRKGFADVL
jgi:lipopolysaccharide transport system permease protein